MIIGTILTGIIAGAAAGSVVGEGMTTKRNSKGRKVVDKIDLKKGFEKASENIIPVAMTALTIVGSMAFLETLTEYQVGLMKEQQELDEIKRSELNDKANVIIDKAAELTLDNAHESYMEAANMAKYYQEKEKIDLLDADLYAGGKKLNPFEVTGLVNMDESDIRKVLEREIYEDADEIKDSLIEAIACCGHYGLMELEYGLDLLADCSDISVEEYEDIIDSVL